MRGSAMSRALIGGPYDGYPIRRARKVHHCDYWHGAVLGRCNRLIEPGALYVEAEIDPDIAGGFGHKRYCADCLPTYREQLA